MAESVRSERGCILVLCGLPASGKTTLTRALIEHVKHDPALTEHFVLQVVCYDQILPQDVEESLINEDQQSTKAPFPSNITGHSSVTEGKAGWKGYRAAILVCVERLLQGLLGEALPGKPAGVAVDVWERFQLCVPATHFHEESPAKCFVLVIDDNMYYSSMRYKYWQLARKYTIGFCQLYLSCDPAESIRRNSQRVESVSPQVIHTMSARLERPDPDDNPWEVNSLLIDDKRNNDWKDIIRLIDHASQNPVQQKEEVDGAAQEVSRQACSESLLHQVDQILRKLVSEYIQAAGDCMSGAQLRDFATKVNSIKTWIHTSVKDGCVSLSPPVTRDTVDASKDPTSPLYVCTRQLFREQVDLLRQDHVS